MPRVAPWHVAKTVILNLTYYPLFLCYCIAGIPCFTLVCIIAIMAQPRVAAMRQFRKAISWFGLGMIHCLPYPWIRVRFTDEEELDPGEGYIVVCNHNAMSDIPLLANVPLDLIQVVKSWPFKIPVLGLIARAAGYVDVTGMSFDVFVEKMSEQLRKGVSVVAFPEGTRSTSTELGQFHSGIFRVALAVKCGIVPLCIHGNERMPPKGSLALRPGVVTMCKMPMLTWDDYRGMSHTTLKQHVRQLMADRLRMMAGAR